jgi:hypothetical protein
VVAVVEEAGQHRLLGYRREQLQPLPPNDSTGFVVIVVIFEPNVSIV